MELKFVTAVENKPGKASKRGAKNSGSAVAPAASSQSLAELLEYIKANKVAKLEPSFRPKLGFTYPGLESMRFEQQLENLESLEKEGLVAKKGFVVALGCPHCSSYVLTLKLACQSCSSGNIVKGNVIEHITCGNTDFEEKFLDSSGRLVCKKCNKRLNALGVDYSRPGFFYRCQSCKGLLPTATEQFACFGCGNESNKETLQTISIPIFVVERNVFNKFADGIKAATEVLSEELARRGIRVTYPASIAGASGIMQQFSIAIYNEHDNNNPVLVGEMADQYPTHETAILSVFAKSIDVDVHWQLLITHEDLDDKANVLAKAYGILVIKVDPLDIAASAWEGADRIFEHYKRITRTPGHKFVAEGQ